MEKNSTRIIIASLDDMDKVIGVLKQLLDHCHVMTFTGSLGAGKTTLVKLLLATCGVGDVITSPTYNYVNSYRSTYGMVFHHFDLYRIKSLQDFITAGFDEYLVEDGARCLIEWPGIIMPLLKSKVCHVQIDYHGTEQREFAITLIP